MDYLLNMDGTHQEEKKLYATLFDLLSFEKIAFSGNYFEFLLNLMFNGTHFKMNSSVRSSLSNLLILLHRSALFY